MLIKICGMTSIEDINICVKNKIDIIGFLLQPESKLSSRADMLNYQIAKELISYVPEGTDSCLLLHLKNINKIIEVIKDLKPTMIQIQIQSTLTLDNLKLIKNAFPNLKITKTFNINQKTDLSEIINDIKKYVESGIIDFILLDSEKGGSGEIHNWELSAKIVNHFNNFPILLAGGLNPNNIKEAITKVKPFGVDVMTGVSNESKEKNPKKVFSFVENINN